MDDLIEVKFISPKKGKGVVAKKPIKKKTIIDRAHVIPIPNQDWEKISETILYNYCYIWQDPKYAPEYHNAITLSISQFINHSYKPNVRYYYYYNENVIEFVTIRDIAAGEEILVNYNGYPSDKSTVWFEVE